MAIFYPEISIIQNLKVRPTEGERTLLNFLYKNLDDSFEVYFNPYLNGDRPDIIIMREGYGVLIIEVKDWNLDDYYLDGKKKWHVKTNDAFIKSPIDQVQKYKTNLYDLHIEKLLEERINDVRKFRIVQCAVYFHCASTEKVEKLIKEPFISDIKYQRFLSHFKLIGYDSLNKASFDQVLKDTRLLSNHTDELFTDSLYKSFKRILSPSMHFKNQATPYHYSDKQKGLIYDNYEKWKLEQRVKGVFGSGKTTVLAARAVEDCKRALKRTNYPHILILTYNITLKNFIHDKLNRISEDFDFNYFTIINYHSFINAELNNIGIDVFVPDDTPKDKVDEYLERNYYSNERLFKENSSKIRKYDAVLIDEIQDYHRPWMNIIKNYFRDPEGDYFVAGDVKQNIYGNDVINKDIPVNVIGRPDTLKYCYRSDLKVCDIAKAFQRNIFKDKYELDDFTENETIGSLGLTVDKEGYIYYKYIEDNKNSVTVLYDIIRNTIHTTMNQISPNDITILGYQTAFLRYFDCYYRYKSHEGTSTMLETIECMYMIQLNKLGKDFLTQVNWAKALADKIRLKLYPRSTDIYKLKENGKIRIKQHIAKLLTVYDLYCNFKDEIKVSLEEECYTNGIALNDFFSLCNKYKTELTEIRAQAFNGNYKKIRDNKKLNFWMNTGKIKISTINSFKGWESEVIFLIIDNLPQSIQGNGNFSFDELLYTGITRAKKDLVIINLGNSLYNQRMKPFLEKYAENT